MKLCTRLSMITSTSIEYFLALPIQDLWEIVDEVSKGVEHG